MQALKQHLNMMPHQRETFEKEERARWRDAERMAAKGAGADDRMDAAAAKRARRAARNLVHCS